MELERRLILEQLRKKLVEAVLYRDIFGDNNLLGNRGIKPLLPWGTAQAKALSYCSDCDNRFAFKLTGLHQHYFTGCVLPFHNWRCANVALVPAIPNVATF